MERDESGEVIGGWLLKLALFMAVVALIGYDFLSIAFTWFSLDDPARDVAVAAASTYDGLDLTRASETAQGLADELEVVIISLDVDEKFIVATVSKQAPTLWLHLLAEDFTQPTTSARARWDN